VERERRGNVWGGGLALAMARRLAEDRKVRMLGPGEGPKLALREGRCLSNDAFLKGGFITYLRNTIPSSMWETSIVSLGIRSWNLTSCYNPAFEKKEMGSSFSLMENSSTL
jgi:hypothetical protein